MTLCTSIDESVVLAGLIVCDQLVVTFLHIAAADLYVFCSPACKPEEVMSEGRCLFITNAVCVTARAFLGGY